MSRLVITGLVLMAGIYAIVKMQMNALDHGVDGTLYTLSIGAIMGLVAGFCGFSLKEVLDWWRGR